MINGELVIDNFAGGASTRIVEGIGNMERLKFEECENYKDWTGCMSECLNACGKPLDALEEFNKYKSLEEQGKLLKNPQDVKGEIIGRMAEFMDEYRSHYLEEKAEAMETAMRIVKSVFADAMKWESDAQER